MGTILPKKVFSIAQFYDTYLTMQNFWERQGWENEDPHLSKMKKLPFQRPFPQVSWGRGLYSIRGPRQIGKTCWIKTILSEKSRLGSGGARDCFYLSCENLRDHQDLAELLKSVRDRSWIFLDEVTFVKEWARAVKHEADAGHIRTLAVTGSDSHDLRKGQERMPGRLGRMGELELLPMEFSEFQEMRRKARWPRLPREEELELFFRIGGFPVALAEAGPEGKKPLEALHILQNWLAGDFARAGKQEVYLREILLALAVTATTPISLQKLSTRTQIGSHHTAQDYVQLLEDCFAVKPHYSVEPNTGSFQFRKEKKFYFRDPLYFWLAFDWAGANPPEETVMMERIAEAVAFESLSRRFPRFGFFSSKRSGEVDFFSRGRWALEVKWASAVQNLSKAYKELRVPEKLVWSKGNFLLEWPGGSP